jgi:hypothetical protein
MKLSHAGLSLAPFVGALCLGACAAPPPAPPAPPPKPPVTAEVVDGLYRGTSTRYQADSRACPSPGLVTLRVKEAQFTYRWNARIQVPASVLPDGSVQGQFGDITLTGQVIPSETGPTGKPTPQRIVGDVSSPSCALHYTAGRRG